MLIAIENVHSAGIIHRDVKPSNFVMGRTPEDKSSVYLVDFGLAKEWGNQSASVMKSFAGTILYSCPEIV